MPCRFLHDLNYYLEYIGQSLDIVCNLASSVFRGAELEISV